MNEKDLKTKKVKWFLGGVGAATIIMLGYRHYEMTIIGLGIDKVINNPELLAQFQEKSRNIMLKSIG